MRHKCFTLPCKNEGMEASKLVVVRAVLAEIESKKALLSVKELVRDAAARELLAAQAEVARIGELLGGQDQLPDESED